ncbi:hypothetical protein [Streptomyces seoulensis]|uniref:hypothetical protein n=1 Tax=Streptomyces seoulensis TaxID=73044 RepID=UPI001FCA529F|nr:hypothetical protein [Streptomyces seoulensis]BDH04921.1 hypothetical protein HEK131_21480 [Streptomyces seoulensis]
MIDTSRTVAPMPCERPPAGFPADLLPLLGLPAPDDLTDAQAAGRACVWGGGPLTLATAVDLGEHEHNGVRIFPQSCSPCIAAQAYRALAPHSVDCAPCHDRDHWRDCPTGGALHRLRVDALRQPGGTCPRDAR